MHVDRVDLAVERVGDLDLDAEAVEQLDERLVLALERRRVGRPPAGPAQSPASGGPADEDASQRRDHGGDAVAGAGRSGCGHPSSLTRYRRADRPTSIV